MTEVAVFDQRLRRPRRSSDVPAVPDRRPPAETLEGYLRGARHEILGLVAGPEDLALLQPVRERATIVVAEDAWPDIRTRGFLDRRGALRVGRGVHASVLVVDGRVAMIACPGRPACRCDWRVAHLRAEVDRFATDFRCRWGRAKDPRSWLLSGVRGQVLIMLAGGDTDATVARRLDVSERTVQRQVKRATDLLGVSSRLELGVQLVRHGLL